jgi:AcrR family transcriptional regulator
MVAVDGRRARRERGRVTVIDTLIDLISEGGGPPSAGQVTERAGISAATLFRYFETLDDLVHEATHRFFERHAERFEVPRLGEGPLAARIDRFTTARVGLYSTIAPVARVARFRAPEQPHLAATLHDVRVRLASQIRTHFAPELGELTPAVADDVVGAIAVLTSFEAWDQMQGDLGRTSRQIRRTWARVIDRTLS